MRYILAVAALTLQLAACGGGGSGPTDAAPTSSSITVSNTGSSSGSSGTAASGSSTGPAVSINAAVVPGGMVQFSFSFSADVGSSFSAASVVVFGGTKAPSVVRVDATHYTLNVTPNSGATTVASSVAANSFTDATGNPNSTGASSNFSLSDSSGIMQIVNGRSLTWHDEFTSNGLPDSTKWGYDTYRNSAGWYNGELEYYADARLINSSVTSGVLSITAKRESTAGFADNGGQAFTSARMITLNTHPFTYGFLEVRAMLPCSLGTWPAIWMLGTLTDNTGTTSNAWPAWGEIDLMEQKGTASSDKQSILGTVHTMVSGGAGTSQNYSVADACTAFHNYQLTWTNSALQIGVDGVVYNTYSKPAGADTTTWPFDQPQYLLLNVAVGGTLGGPVPAAFTQSTTMQVQHVRLYQ